MKNIKSNKGITNMTLITIVLVIIILMLAGAVVYLVKNPNTTYITQNVPIEQSKLSSTVTENEISVMEVKKEMSADERFAIYAKGLKESISEFYEFGETFDGEKYKCAVPVDYKVNENIFGIENIILNYNGDLHINIASDSALGKKYGNDYKIASNIIKAGALYYGQDASIIIFAIENSGNLRCCLISDTTKLELKTITNLKNIIEVQSYNNGESPSLVAIDIDGKMYKINVN